MRRSDPKPDEITWLSGYQVNHHSLDVDDVGGDREMVLVFLDNEVIESVCLGIDNSDDLEVTRILRRAPNLLQPVGFCADPFCQTAQQVSKLFEIRQGRLFLQFISGKLNLLPQSLQLLFARIAFTLFLLKCLGKERSYPL